MNAAANTLAESHTVHPWEKAGLGKAPYRYLGCAYDVGPHRFIGKDGLEWTVGYEGQPMGCCAYCLQGIAECHKIRSADGKEFTVGCDCVARIHADGEPLLTEVERASRKLRNAKSRKRAAAKGKSVAEELDALLADSPPRRTLAGSTAARPASR